MSGCAAEAARSAARRNTRTLFSGFILRTNCDDLRFAAAGFGSRVVTDWWLDVDCFPTH